MIAGSRFTFLARSGRVHPTSFAMITVPIREQAIHNCKSWIMILYKDTHTVGNSKKSTDDQRDTEFFEHDFEKICKTDLIQCDSTDDQCCTLGTTVSTGIHQHWDEGYEKRDGCECISYLVMIVPVMMEVNIKIKSHGIRFFAC